MIALYLQSQLFNGYGFFIPVAILEHDVDDGDVDDDDDDDDPNPTLFNEHEPFSLKRVVNNQRHLCGRFDSNFVSAEK